MSEERQPAYSHDNPYARWAANNEEVRRNADDWEMRQPLTASRLAAFNEMAEQKGFTTYVESYHADTGVFQADKYTADLDLHVEVIGKFKNHGGQSVYEDAHDFTVSFHEKDDIVDYLYTNDLNQALRQSEQWPTGKSSEKESRTRVQAACF